MDTLSKYLGAVADFICGYPLFFTLIGGGIFLFFYSGFISIRRLPHSLRILRERQSVGKNQISSFQALMSVAAATVGMGNIAGVTIAIIMGGPGVVFWMWMSALVGMCTKYHEGVLAIKYRTINPDGSAHGGTMHIIRNSMSRRWYPLATFFAVAGMFGTLCIMNANQLTEAIMSTSSSLGFDLHPLYGRLIIGIGIAAVVGAVVLGGITRIARVASFLVPFMVAAYFIMVLYIILTHLPQVPAVFSSIFRQAFTLEAGWGALCGIALIGARRAALVNDAGVGTASIMHGSSSCREPVKEGLVAMLCPALDSGFVCTLTAFAILLCMPPAVDGLVGLDVALRAFGSGIPLGNYLLMFVVLCFAVSSMFSYSFYGRQCARYLFGERGSQFYTWFFILSLILFAMVPLSSAVALCDLFYALMAFPTMLTLILLRKRVKEETNSYFSGKNKNQHDNT